MRKLPLSFLALLLVLTAPTLAQRSGASIRGTVTAEGAPVVGAEVTVVGAQTGLTRTTQTNQSGIYTFGDLPAGLYEVLTSREGFASTTVRDITLNVADVRQVDVELTPGEVSEEITVTSPTVLVETIGGEVAGLITGEQVRELPLNGRNFAQLALLMPGVSAPDGFDTTNKGLLTGSDLSISGGGVTGNLWTVDGANNNDVGSNRTILVYPSVDAIEEFKVHRNSYGPEFGGASGAQINLITRSGTNQFKASAFFFHRDDSLNEKNFFLEEADQEKEKLDRDDFGYTLAGPLFKEKLHFFASQEWNDEIRGTVRTGFVPTAAERMGDFSGSGIAGCSPPVPIDPLTGQPFPGNVIPADRLSPAGLLFLQLYPQPNTTPTGGSCTNWVGSVDTPIDWRQENIRLDWNATDRSRVMVRYTQDSWENPAPNAGQQNGLWGDDPFPAVDSTWDQPGRSLVAQLNQTFGGQTVNTLQVSYSGNEIEIDRGGINAGLNSQITAAVPTIFPDKFAGDDITHPVFWGAQGYAPLWNISPWRNQQDLLVFKDDYQRVFGEHWLKAGVLYSDNKKDEFLDNTAEVPQFWGAAGVNGWGATTGNVLADFLLEDMTFGFAEGERISSVEQRWEDLELYLGDSWQAMPNLTVDYGVRYSKFYNPVEADDEFASFNPDLFDPELGGDACNGMMLPPGSTACADAGFAGGSAGPNDSLVEEEDDNLAPRVGFAWDVFGKGSSVLRGGFGQFYQRDRLTPWLVMGLNPPFSASQTGIRKLDSAEEPCPGCFDPLSGGVPLNGYDVDRETPYNLQWNLTWEQRLLAETTLEVSYVASRGKNLLRRLDINQVPSGDPNGNGVSDRLEFVRCGDDLGCQAGLRPFSPFSGSILLWRNDGESEYESIQSQLVSRFGRGSHFQASYTWSDLEADDPLTDSGGGPFPGNVTDLDNLGLDWGHSAIHREHVFNTSLVWNGPSFDGKGGLQRAVLGDWSIGAIASWASGAALTVYNGGVPGINGLAGTGFAQNQRPIRVPGEPCKARGGSSQQWLNPNAWTLVGYELGDTGQMARRGECDGPEFFQIDLSFYKHIPLSERVNAQLRFEIFNLTDETNFILVDTTLDPTSVTLDAPLGEATRVVDFERSGTFGQAFGVRDPRQIQLGLKLSFN